MHNVISIDLEDREQIIHRAFGRGEIAPSEKLRVNSFKILDKLSEHKAHATFFILGEVAKYETELIRLIIKEGHEIALHGYTHKLLHDSNPEEFRADIAKSKTILEDIAGKPVWGYRAPSFSLTEDTMWALYVLSELGIKYDSSLFLTRPPRYGVAGFPSQLANGIIEFPLASVKFAGRDVPFGGGYFRLFSHRFISKSTANLNKKGVPMVFYFHPYDFSEERHRTRLDGLNHGQRLRLFYWNQKQSIGNKRCLSKLERLLKDFEFVKFEDLLPQGGFQG